MKLYLQGHDYKYAAEQMLLTLFPGQRPLYPAGPPAEGEDFLVLTLTRENGRAEGEAQLCWQGKTYASRDSIPDPGEPGETEADRTYQQLLKLCFYRCGTAALGAAVRGCLEAGREPVLACREELAPFYRARGFAEMGEIWAFEREAGEGPSAL